MRRHIFNPEPIEWEDHARWFDTVLQDPARHLLIAEQQDNPIGVFRLEPVEGGGEVSVYLSPEFMGRGLGAELVRAGCEWVRINLPEMLSLRAKILGDNSASLKAFEAAGFKESYRLYERRSPE